MNIHDLVVELRRLDNEAAAGYVGHLECDYDWPTVGFLAGSDGHAVISVHPDDIDAAVAVLRRFPDGAACMRGAESLLYDPVAALRSANIRHRWHI